MLDLKRLRHFVVVAEEGKITRAAQQLRITQSALTRSIQNLEQSLKATLFVRGSNGLELTVAGRRLIEHAGRILANVDATEADILGATAQMKTRLRLGVSFNFMSEILPDAVFDTVNALPSLRLTVVDGMYSSLVWLLLAGRLDMAFTTIADPDERYGVEMEPLVTLPIQICVICREDHPVLVSSTRKKALMESRWVFPEPEGFGATRRHISTASLFLKATLVFRWGCSQR